MLCIHYTGHFLKSRGWPLYSRLISFAIVFTIAKNAKLKTSGIKYQSGALFLASREEFNKLMHLFGTINYIFKFLEKQQNCEKWNEIIICFLACCALWCKLSLMCPRCVHWRPPLEGNLVSAFLRVFRERSLFSSWNIQLDSKVLLASLFCFGWCGCKKGGKTETATVDRTLKKQLVNKAKQQLYTYITLFCSSLS